MNHDEFYSDTWRDKNSEWLDYVKNDKLCTAFSYARHTKAMQNITGFGLSDCLSLPGLGWKHFHSLRTEEYEPIHPYNDKYMKQFFRQSIQSIKEGRVCAFNQHYTSKNCSDLLKIISEEKKIKGNIYDIIKVLLEHRKKIFKIFEKENESKLNDYRDEDEEEKENFINEKLGKLPIHQLIKQMKIDELPWDFDAVSLYPSAM